MRFFRGVLASAAVLGLLACGDDEGTGPGDGDAFNATYQLVSVEGEDVPATFTADDGEGGTIELVVESGEVDFNDDGTWSGSINFSIEGQDDSSTGEGTYEVDGNTITLTDDTDDSTITATIDGDTITYTDGDTGLEVVFER
jgi:hypothetical protein